MGSSTTITAYAWLWRTFRRLKQRAANISGIGEISPEAGRALEILGHAIEYLPTNSCMRVDRFQRTTRGVEAVQLLMAVNRQDLFQHALKCPRSGERLRALLGRRMA